jgi:ankyrin repeat protein
MKDSQCASSIGLLDLPNELIILIGNFLPSERVLAGFTRVNRKLRHVLSDSLVLRNIHQHNSRGLLWAVRHNRVEAVYWFVRLGAGLENLHRVCTALTCPLSYWGERPLSRAVRDGNLRIVKVLVKAGANVLGQYDEPATAPFDLSPLSMALEQRNEPIARVLMSAVENVDTLLWHVEIDDILPARSRKLTLLHFACEKGLLRTVAHLLLRGANPNLDGRRNALECVNSLLSYKDHHQRRLDDNRIDILRLLFSYGLRVRAEMKLTAKEHRDPRVRYMFTRAKLKFRRKSQAILYPNLLLM